MANVKPLRDIPQTITVIPRAVMDEQGATTLRDASGYEIVTSYQLPTDARAGNLAIGDDHWITRLLK